MQIDNFTIKLTWRSEESTLKIEDVSDKDTIKQPDSCYTIVNGRLKLSVFDTLGCVSKMRFDKSEHCKTKVMQKKYTNLSEYVNSVTHDAGKTLSIVDFLINTMMLTGVDDNCPTFSNGVTFTGHDIFWDIENYPVRLSYCGCGFVIKFSIDWNVNSFMIYKHEYDNEYIIRDAIRHENYIESRR